MTLVFIFATAEIVTFAVGLVIGIVAAFILHFFRRQSAISILTELQNTPIVGHKNFDEIEESKLTNFKTFNDFFTRKLK